MGLRLKQRSLDEKRREALNKILDTKGKMHDSMNDQASV